MRVRGCPLLAADLTKNFEAYWLAGAQNGVPAPWPAGLSTTIDEQAPAAITINGEPASGLFV